MPSSIIAHHNNRTITFTEDDHSYIDDKGKQYCSVTTLIGKAFEKFDAEAIAKKNYGDNWKEYVEKWDKIGAEAAYAGTRLHHNCECLILENEQQCYLPENITETINFNLAKKKIYEIKNIKNAIKFEPEKLVFSERLGLAGSIDCLVTNNDNSYIIFDFKNIKTLKMENAFGKTGIIQCTKNMPDTNYWHYALQLQLYEILLKAENYVDKNAKFIRELIVFSNSTVKNYRLPNVIKEAKELILWMHKK